LNFPLGVAVNSSDSLYVCDHMSDRVVVFDNGGAMVTILDTAGGLPVDDPRANRLIEFNPAGAVVTIFLGKGDAGIDVDASGTIYMDYRGSASGSSVAWFNPAGGPVTSISGAAGVSFFLPQDVKVDSNGHIFVADYLRARVVELNPDGTAFLVHTQAGGVSFAGPSGLAIDAADNIYMLELGKIFKYAPP
jgi:DNA-binding beta-propeller fold protein YncE